MEHDPFYTKEPRFQRAVFSLAILLNTCAFTGFAQDTAKTAEDTVKTWTAGGVGNLNLNQVSFINWAAGGENAFSLTGIVNLYAKYKKEKTSWDNTLNMTYGIIKSGNADVRKNDDFINMSSKLGKKSFIKNVHYSLMMSFKSQFAPGYDYPNDSVIISDFLAPGYVITSIGMDYKPDDLFTVFISPFTGKTTIVNNRQLADSGAYGVDAATFDNNNTLITSGKKMRNEFGGYIKIMLKKEVLENITFQTKLDLFSNYLKNPQNIDINWDNLITLKVNKYISASISTQLIYDDDIKIEIDTDGDSITDKSVPRTQFKEAFGLGLSYKF